MKIDINAYEKLLSELALITEVNLPYTRRSFSPKFIEGREWIAQKMKELGLEVRIDCAGNLIGKKRGKIDERNPAHTIATGSHSDSVLNGGRYDGIAGVIAGLECVSSLNRLGIELYHNFEVIDFLAEEPSEWGVSCVGSRGVSGFLDEKLLQLKHPETSEELSQAIVRMGGNPLSLKKINHIKAFFELHIEQGKVLENQQISIGIVNSIVGIKRIEIEFLGESNHAGTTPMNLRKDAGITACKMAMFGNELAKEFSMKKDIYFVATSGQIVFKPNASNVVCGQAKVVFDVRSDAYSLMKDFENKLSQQALKIAKEDEVYVKSFEVLTDTQPIYCDKTLMDILKNVCKKDNISFLVMPSGAGHDSAFMSYVAPVGMVFVPSEGGKSHCPEEYTSKQDLGLGANVLLEAILEYDKNFSIKEKKWAEF